VNTSNEVGDEAEAALRYPGGRLKPDGPGRRNISIPGEPEKVKRLSCTMPGCYR